jgi:hypothetical protein
MWLVCYAFLYSYMLQSASVLCKKVRLGGMPTAELLAVNSIFIKVLPTYKITMTFYLFASPTTTKGSLFSNVFNIKAVNYLCILLLNI